MLQIQQLHRASSLPPVEQNGMLAVIGMYLILLF